MQLAKNLTPNFAVFVLTALELEEYMMQFMMDKLGFAIRPELYYDDETYILAAYIPDSELEKLSEEVYDQLMTAYNFQEHFEVVNQFLHEMFGPNTMAYASTFELGKGAGDTFFARIEVPYQNTQRQGVITDDIIRQATGESPNA
jgi:hypothetical protein